MLTINTVVDRHVGINMRMAARRYKRVQAQRREDNAKRKEKPTQNVKLLRDQMRLDSKQNYEKHVPVVNEAAKSVK